MTRKKSSKTVIDWNPSPSAARKGGNAANEPTSIVAGIELAGDSGPPTGEQVRAFAKLLARITAKHQTREERKSA
ncbi:MAG: N-acetylmuramoyl-L-alanine amidase [Chloroflexota bacterium]